MYFLNKHALRLDVVFFIQKQILDKSIGSLGYAIYTRSPDHPHFVTLTEQPGHLVNRLPRGLAMDQES